MLAQNIPVSEVADKLGLHRNTVGKWWKDPEFAERVRKEANSVNATRKRAWNTEVKKMLSGGARKAVAVLLQEMEQADNARDRIAAAKAVLDRTGFPAGLEVTHKPAEEDLSSMDPADLEVLIKISDKYN